MRTAVGMMLGVLAGLTVGCGGQASGSPDGAGAGTNAASRIEYVVPGGAGTTGAGTQARRRISHVAPDPDGARGVTVKGANGLERRVVHRLLPLLGPGHPFRAVTFVRVPGITPAVGGIEITPRVEGSRTEWLIGAFRREVVRDGALLFADGDGESCFGCSSTHVGPTPGATLARPLGRSHAPDHHDRRQDGPAAPAHVRQARLRARAGSEDESRLRHRHPRPLRPPSAAAVGHACCAAARPRLP